MKLGDHKDFAIRPDAQAFDEVRIITIPRYKTSGLSGDEWRISARMQFLRKGVVHHEVSVGSVETACGMAYAEYVKAVDDGKAYFAGDGKVCDQEGCVDLATVWYRLKRRFCNEGHGSEPIGMTIRSFCERHKKRGDCGLDDADRNYEPEAQP